MSFSRPFSAATWLWRRLTSRPARLFYIGVLIIVVISGITLRVEAVLFERRVHKVMSTLSSLRVGVTPKAEVLSRMAGVKIDESSLGNSMGSSLVMRSRGVCDADKCFWIEVSSPMSDVWGLDVFGRVDSKTMFLVWGSLGFRLRSLDANVKVNSDKVSSLGYLLILSTPDPGYPGVLRIKVSSRKNLADRLLDYIADESPNYQVSHYFKWPRLFTDIDFTPDAPTELVSHAFNLKLQCVWSLRGCRTANELLPEAEQDRLRIEHAAFDRMNGPNQCPDWILPRRARDTEDILLVEVKNAGPEFVETGYGTKYRLASLRLVRVLKGKLDRPLENVGVSPDMWVGMTIVHNSAIDLLNPGQKLLLFSGGSTNIDEPCEGVAATESALQTTERTIGTAQP